MAPLLCLVFFLSGAAALVFETLWFHQAGLALGNSVWASSLVLAGFMGGLALGNGLVGRAGHRITRPVRLYAGLELAIAASGVALVVGLPALTPVLTPLLRPFLDDPLLLNLLRLPVALALLLIPSTAMGATLPLLVAALYARDPSFGRVLGLLYGWNTLGAVAGALLAEVLLVAWLGVRGSALLAAGLDVVAAGIALSLAPRVASRAAPAPPRGAPTPRARGLLLAAFLFGGILLALEVVWFRFLLLFARGSSLAFAVMLAVVLAGIGLGGLTGARSFRRSPDAHVHLPAAALAAAAACLGTYAGFHVLGAPSPHSATAHWPDLLRMGAALMLPVSWISGLVFTWIGEALLRAAPGETRAAGYLTLANTTGAMLGSLVGGFVLLPLVGIETSVRALAAAYLAAGVLLWVVTRPAPRRAAASAGVALAAAAAVFLATPADLMRTRYLRYPIERFARLEGSRPVAIRETLTETILYLQRDLFGVPLYHRLVTNSHSMSTTQYTAQRYMRLFVYWPVAVHPDLRDALLISYGVGVTAQALTQTPGLERIDVVDISRDILELSAIAHPDPATHPLEDPRVRVHIEDGRYFLQSTRRRYDLITGEPPPPKAQGIVNLYTREYFEQVHDRLREGGIATYWLPVHVLLEPEAKAVIRAFCAAFADCSLWSGSGLDWMLVGTRGARGPVSEAHFARQWRDPVVGQRLRDLGLETPEQLGALFLAGADDLAALTRGTPPLDDDHPKRIGSRLGGPGEALATFRPWLDPERARRRFATSGLVARLWPPALRERSLEPWFAWRALADDHLNGVPMDYPVRLAAAHPLIVHGVLRALPLWLLGGTADQQRALRAAGPGAPRVTLHFQRGIGALAARDFAAAVHHLETADRAPGASPPILYARLYATAMAGDLSAATDLAHREGLPAGTPQDRRVWRFLAETFALPDPP